MGKLAKKKNQLLEVSNECINCNASLDLDQRFCSNCGGKRMFNRITWRNLFEDFIDRFLNIENAFLKTFIGLFKHPEDVIGGYMNGMRKKYLPAFSYFAIAITVAGVYNFILRKWFYDNYITAQTGMYENSPTAELQQTWMTSWSDIILEYQSLVMFLFIPILTLLSRVVFWNYKKYNLVEHFVIYLYAYSHFSILTSTIGIMLLWSTTLTQLFSFIVSIGMFVYIGYVLKVLFELDWGRLILKTGLLFLIIGVFFVGTTFTLGIYFGIKAANGELKGDNPFTKSIRDIIDNAEKEKKRNKEKIQDGDTLVIDSLGYERNEKIDSTMLIVD